MSLHFYNTITRDNEEFKPIDPVEVRMYTCGPTVYNYAHIGNFRAYIFEDQLRRYLKFKGYKVKQVMNLTDVDDKIIRACAESGAAVDDYTAPFKKAFFKSLNDLNIEEAEVYPEATDHIPDMENMIMKLLDKGLAYRSADGNIFYKISTFPAYGRLQNLDMDNMRQGGRVSYDEYEKESVHDFALWKAWKPEDGDIFWDSPLGKGRPGWHIECSAMSGRYLGETFDIHTGGVDNIFPHHENEIAQSEGANGQKFVNYWLHCEHLIWDNEKMSKSLGNIIYLDGLVENGYTLREVRYALMSTHYRQKLNFSFKLLNNARSALQRIDDFFFEIANAAEGSETRQEVRQANDEMLQNFEAAMDDDLNISRALAALFENVRTLNKLRAVTALNRAEKDVTLHAMKKIDTVLGVLFSATDITDEIDEERIREMIEERGAARNAKNWAEADRIRDELLAEGIELIDRKDGTDFRRR